MRFDVKGDMKNFTKHLGAMEKRVVSPSANAAINASLNKMRTEVVRSVATAEQLPTKLVKGRLLVQRSKVKILRGRLIALTAPVPLVKAGKPRQLKKGARAGKHLVTGGFVAKMKSGHVGIFKRSGKSRLPIKEQKINIHDNLEGKANFVFKTKSRKLFSKEFERQMNFRLKKLAAKHGGK